MQDIPLPLRHSIEAGNCVLFLGAGIGTHLRDPEGNPAPSGSELAKELAEQFSIDYDETYTLAMIAEVVCIRKGRSDLEAYLRKRLSSLEPDEYLLWLFSLRWRAIYSTNYDNGIEHAYELLISPVQTPVTISVTADFGYFDPRLEIPVIHLHGILFGPSMPRIVITESDYLTFENRRKMLFERLKLDYLTSTILYIGYSNRDPNWRQIIEEIRREFAPNKPPTSYRLAPTAHSIETEILRNIGVETIESSLKDFVEVARCSIDVDNGRTDRLSDISDTIPLDFVDQFRDTPVSVLRLLTSWQYVNVADFNEKPNLREFLRGDRPNWGLIANKEYFERDIQELAYDELLDFATSDTRFPKSEIVLGPAGYGVTTLLMALATDLVRDRAGKVFMLRPGRTPLQGDIEFCTTIFDEPVFFFIDNASDHSYHLSGSIARLRSLNRSAMFVLGDRLNEWRQNLSSVRAKEFEIEPLSDPEILRLLALLTRHGELGVLEHLDHNFRFATIKRKYKQELLIALREATDGRSFDAILEDEFRGIGDDQSRRLYLTVCCFYQHGALARDTILAQSLSLTVRQLYDETGPQTEGVVVWECVEDTRGLYAARARHRTIAAIVWERCGDRVEQERILRLALGSLNLTYGIDKEAFEHFIRSDRMVDQIKNLDGKIRFFELACTKDPESPYVRQHYARMLWREKRTELALQQIDEAIRMNSRSRVFYHTKGLILMQLAESVESQEIARRRMAQSEDNFRVGLRMRDNDEYCYVGLAQLYFGWAQRASSDEESAEYLAKAEGIISEGLRKVAVKDALWVESSKIEGYLRNESGQIDALRHAVSESPGSIVPRYLLGRAYREKGECQAALEVLDPIVKNYPDESRSFLEYALALVDIGKGLGEAIAVLKLSTLYGLSDPRFIATLGGLLFMNRDFTAADEVFKWANHSELPWSQLTSIRFHPSASGDPGQPLRLQGKVAEVRAGYALIDTPEFPRLLCPAPKFSGVIMERGLTLDFQLAFSARGPVAISPRRTN